MTNDQERELAMNRKVQKLYTDNKNAFDGLPGWADFWTPFDTGISAIQTMSEQQALSIGGHAQDKKDKRAALEKDAHFIHSRLIVLALNTKNTKLADEMDFTYTDMHSASEANALIYTKLIYDRAVSNAAALAATGYDVTEAKTTGLNTKMEAYKAVLPAPKLAHDTKTFATDGLDDQFKGQRLWLQSLDKVAALLHESNEDLYTAWQKARKMDKRVGQHSNLRGVVKDSVSKEPVPHATIKIVELDKTMNSGAKGNYSSGHLPEGYYIVEATAPGYQKASVQITIVHEQPLLMDLMLVHV